MIKKLLDRLTFWLSVLAITFCILEPIALGEPANGQDYLGYMQRNFDRVSANRYFTGDAVGGLDFSFGESVDVWSPVLSNYHPLFFRIHLINTVCVRNGNCGPYEIGKGYNKATFDKAVRRRNPKILKFVRERTALYKGLAGNNPGTKFIISPALEHDLSKSAWRILADEVLRVFPEVQLGNSPDGGISVESYKGAWIERHGDKNLAGADIVSPDGTEVTDMNIRKYLHDTANVKIRFAWTRSYNLRTNQPPADPRARANTMTPQTVDLVNHIYDIRGAAPVFTGTQCSRIEDFRFQTVIVKKKKVTTPRNWIYKPLAEDYPSSNDPRQNKPVSITAMTTPLITLLTFKGEFVGQLAKYGNYQSLIRHYSGYAAGSKVGGYTFEKTAKGLSGSPYIWMQSGNRCYGPIITGQRNGSYR